MRIYQADKEGNIIVQISLLIGNPGNDNFIVSGDPFNGVDVSAEGRQVVNQPNELNDFVIAEDRFVLNATDLEIQGEPVFTNGSAEELSNSDITNANIVVIQASFANATAIAATEAANGAGVFIYFNDNLQINRLVYSDNLGDVDADISILGNIRTLEGDDALNALPTFSAANFLVSENTLVGDENNNALIGTGGEDFIDGRGGNDTIDGQGSSDTLGAGNDTFAFSGDLFDGVDVSSPDRQIVGNEDFVADFNFTDDQYRFNASDFGVSTLDFFALDGNTKDAVIPAGANAIVLLNSDNDDDPTTSFLAGTAATQIAGLTDQNGAGFFVYFNSNLQLNRLVYSTNLNDPSADLKILSRQTDLTGQDAVDALNTFSADNFAIDLIGDMTTH